MPAKLKVDSDPQHQLINQIAWILYGEARGEGEAGMRDVASVIQKRFGTVGDYSEVINKPYAFSVTNGGVEPDKNFRWNKPKAAADRDMQTVAEQIAIEMVGGSFKPTVDATHYYNPEHANPSWGGSMVGSEMRGRHKFGNLPGEYGTPAIKRRN